MTKPDASKIQVKAISITEVMGWPTTAYNLYVKLPDGRFLTVLRTGNPVDKERLAKYANKGVTTLYATERELSEAVGAEIAQGAADARVEALNKVSGAVFEELRTLGVSEASYNHAKAVGKAVRGMVEREPKLSDTFAKFQDLMPGDVKHSLMVSAISTVLCSSMDWIKPATIENVALGALLHDLGKLSLPPAIINADPMELNSNDRKILEGHSEAGRALLAQVKTVPEDVIMIVAHHHERSDGSGYPVGIKDIYIHPLARVVAIANEIVERHEADQKAGKSTSIKVLVETLLDSQASKFNRDVVKSLRALLATDALK